MPAVNLDAFRHNADASKTRTWDVTIPTDADTFLQWLKDRDDTLRAFMARPISRAMPESLRAELVRRGRIAE